MRMRECSGQGGVRCGGGGSRAGGVGMDGRGRVAWKGGAVGGRSDQWWPLAFYLTFTCICTHTPMPLNVAAYYAPCLALLRPPCRPPTSRSCLKATGLCSTNSSASTICPSSGSQTSWCGGPGEGQGQAQHGGGWPAEWGRLASCVEAALFGAAHSTVSEPTL